jgi:hypothetical protein
MFAPDLIRKFRLNFKKKINSKVMQILFYQNLIVISDLDSSYYI